MTNRLNQWVSVGSPGCKSNLGSQQLPKHFTSHKYSNGLLYLILAIYLGITGVSLGMLVKPELEIIVACLYTIVSYLCSIDYDANMLLTATNLVLLVLVAFDLLRWFTHMLLRRIHHAIDSSEGTTPYYILCFMLDHDIRVPFLVWHLLNIRSLDAYFFICWFALVMRLIFFLRNGSNDDCYFHSPSNSLGTYKPTIEPSFEFILVRWFSGFFSGILAVAVINGAIVLGPTVADLILSNTGLPASDLALAYSCITINYPKGNALTVSRDYITKFFVGLLDGDGEISVYHHDNRITLRLCIKLTYDVHGFHPRHIGYDESLHSLANSWNYQLLKAIGAVFGVRAESRTKGGRPDRVVWQLDDKKQILNMLPIFNKYPLLTSRKNIQLNFMHDIINRCFDLSKVKPTSNRFAVKPDWNMEYYRTNKQQHVMYAPHVVDAQVAKLAQLNLSALPHINEWLAGFIEAEGGHTFRDGGKGQLSFCIGQNEDLFLIEYIRNRFKSGNTIIAKKQKGSGADTGRLFYVLDFGNT